MPNLDSEILSLPAWKATRLLQELAWALKQDVELPEYVAHIANGTGIYESKLRELWEEFKNAPTQDAAEAFVAAAIAYSSELWPQFFAQVLGVEVEDLTPEQLELLQSELDKHHQYLRDSLLPDVVAEIAKGREAFDNYDYRTIFMYAGALWTLGMLGTIMFDGLSLRDLADLFIFLGPNDEATCTGDRGCDQHANQIYTVAEILARDIIPGHMQCLTNCRHMLIPIASPLKG